mgnify:FL=1|tara:strand:+ start:457 stop:1347 length:891 start_codon:yes stop_codon:yes gene_type:complete
MDAKSKFISNYIKEINSTGFKKKFKSINPNPFSSQTELDEFIKTKLHKEISKVEKEIFNEWKDRGFVKASIGGLANKYKFKESHLKEYLLKVVGNNLCEELNNEGLNSLIKEFIDKIEENFKNTGFKTIKSDFRKVFLNSLYFNFQRGFPVNLENINSGVMTANAGDSHQFLFLARAILAGYECSNVDVRSSRYDAIIDYRERLFKIQIKGITSTKTSKIEFKDRDRGGQGIDYKHERNRGKKITAKDCDIYAAVDKNSGTCYLIPMKWVDKNGYESLKFAEIQKFKEKWDIFNSI